LGLENQYLDILPNQLSRMAAVELTVVVPSFNEIDNVEPLIERLHAALDGIEWEVIYVDDDSPDGTAAKVRELAQTDPRVRCIQRIGRRGLSTAVIEGMLASSAPYLAVIDADFCSMTKSCCRECWQLSNWMGSISLLAVATWQGARLATGTKAVR